MRKSKENAQPKYRPEVTPHWTASVPAIQEKDLSDTPANMIKKCHLLLGDGDCKNFAYGNVDAPTRYYILRRAYALAISSDRD